MLFFQPQGRVLPASKCLPGCGLAPGLQGVQGDPPGRLGLGVLTAGLQGLLLGRPCWGASGTKSGRGGVLGRRGGLRLFCLWGGGGGAAGVLHSAGGGPLPRPGSWRRPRGGLTLGFLRCIRSSHAQNRLLFQGDSKLIFLERHEGAITVRGRDGQEGPIAGPSFPKRSRSEEVYRTLLATLGTLITRQKMEVRAPSPALFKDKSPCGEGARLRKGSCDPFPAPRSTRLELLRAPASLPHHELHRGI